MARPERLSEQDSVGLVLQHRRAVTAPPAPEPPAREPDPDGPRTRSLKARLTADEMARYRGMYMVVLGERAQAGELPYTLQDFTAELVMDRLRELEQAHGGPVRPVKPGEIPTGRPVGS